MSDKKTPLSPSLQRKYEELVSDHEESFDFDFEMPDAVKQLRRVGADFLKEHRFQKGDLVEWKPGCKNKRCPSEGVPALVIEVLDTPLLTNEEKSAGSPYFREPLDIVCGFIDSDNDFMLYHFDSRRFRPFQGE